MKKVIPVVIAVIENENKFLLTKRVQEDSDDKRFHGFWQLPGGELEFGEDPIFALKREVREEVGVEITKIKLIPKIFKEVRGNWNGLFISYHCNLKDKTQKILLNKEASEYNWFRLEEISKLKYLPLSLEIIKVSYLL